MRKLLPVFCLFLVLSAVLPLRGQEYRLKKIHEFNFNFIGFPAHLKVDSKNHIYTIGRGKIIKLDSTSKALFPFGTVGSTGSLNRQFWGCYGVALDAQEMLYLGEVENQRIQKFNPEGEYMDMFSTSSLFYFTDPEDIAIDKQGYIYILLSGSVLKLNARGSLIAKIITSGQESGKLSLATKMSIDSEGNLYIVDMNYTRVQKFNTNGQYFTQIGSVGNRNGQFEYVTGVGTDKDGNLYIADQKNNCIQKWNTKGVFLQKITVVPFLGMTISPKGEIYVRNDSNIYVYGINVSENIISGVIFSDENQNCKIDSGEQPLANVKVVVQPGNYYGMTDNAGKYTIRVDIGKYTISQILKDTSIIQVIPICQKNNPTLTFNTYGNIIQNVNFSDKTVLQPRLSANITSNRRRRCFLSTTTVNYSNTGYADAQNVKVYVKMPKYVTLKSADKPYVLDKDSNYVFIIGTLKAGQSGQIQIKDSVVCQRGITGLTVCTKAWITPANPVTPQSSWDQSDIILSEKCIENGQVKFTLTNSGQGSMADSSEFRVFLNAQLSLRKNFKLAKGDSLVLRIPANGKTVRLEANQRPDHPHKSQSNLTLEGCVASASEVVSKGFVDVLPQDDSEAEVAIECLPIIDSYDPNDKQVSPIGTTDQHFTPTTASLKYLIRFQNTGSDTAYTVVLVDTLSEHLDMATLEVQGSSHPYKLGVSGKGRPVLTFTFNNINLPHAKRDSLGSNGFIQFSITPNAGLAEKTLIENFADIYFDYNDPIRTNTTTNRIYDVPPVVDVVNALPVNEVVLRKPQITTLAAALIDGKTTITIDGSYFEKVAEKNTVTINGIQATVIQASEGKLVVTIPTPKDPISGKVTVRTDGGEAISELELVLGNEEAIALRGVKLYPNPSSGVVTIDFTQTQERITKVVVYNSVGKQILVVVPQGKTQLVSELNLTPYGTGMYLISIQAKDKQLTRKLVVK